MVRHEAVGNKVNSFFKVTNLKFIDDFLVAKLP